MKPSHFTTPRSMHDAVFIPSADPIERQRRNDTADAVVLFGCTLAAAGVGFILLVWG
jgi:hypothetical protein